MTLAPRSAVQRTSARALGLLLGLAAVMAPLELGAQEVESGTLRVLESFPVHVTDRDEEPAARKLRLREIAAAIDAASSSPRDRAALLTLVRFETYAAAYVHEGRCADGPRGEHECDSGRAKGLFQLHGDVPDDLLGQARLAITIWRGALKLCRGSAQDDYTGAFSGYGTGGKCGLASSRERARYMRSILSRL